jgi:ferritin-like protein
MSDYHEPHEELSAECRDIHRALTSLREEIEAVDWYHQRIELCSDQGLASILRHNRDEEIEHACMTLEWLRRKMPGWEQQLRSQLFQAEQSIDENSQHDLGIRQLREEAS